MSRRITESSIKQLQSALKRMGWTLHVPEFNREGHFEGAVVGTHAFCSAVMSLVLGEQEDVSPPKDEEAEGSSFDPSKIKVEGE